jgi:hypothetical protein
MRLEREGREGRDRRVCVCKISIYKQLERSSSKSWFAKKSNGKKVSSRYKKRMAKEQNIVLKTNSYQYVEKLRVVFNVKFTIFFIFTKSILKSLFSFNCKKNIPDIFCSAFFFKRSRLHSLFQLLSKQK